MSIMCLSFAMYIAERKFSCYIPYSSLSRRGRSSARHWRTRSGHSLWTRTCLATLSYRGITWSLKCGTNASRKRSRLGTTTSDCCWRRALKAAPSLRSRESVCQFGMVFVIVRRLFVVQYPSDIRYNAFYTQTRVSTK